MTFRIAFRRSLPCCVILAALATSAQAAPRAYVASHGNDANTATFCTLANPCRSFTAAHTVVDAGGEIVALDTAGYGAVTITKSVTITANPGYFAGIAASSGNAVTVAAAGVKVTLRGLVINGVGAEWGVRMTAGEGLNIENCVVSGFVNQGIEVANVALVRITNTLVRGNGATGILFQGAVNADVVNTQAYDNGFVGMWAYEGGARVSVTDSVASGNSWGFVTRGNVGMTIIRGTASHNVISGFQAEDGSIMTVGYSQASHNNYGLRRSGDTSALESLGNNLVRQNKVANTSGAITSVSGS